MGEPDGYLLNRPTIERMGRVFQRVERAPQNEVFPGQADRRGGIWLPWKNNDESDCPPYGVVRVTGEVQVGSGSPANRLITGEQPDSSSGKVYGVNGAVKVKAGHAGFITFDRAIVVAFDSGPPSIGEAYGAKAGQWEASTSFTVQLASAIGIFDTDRSWMLAFWQPPGGDSLTFCPTQLFAADEIVQDDISVDDLSLNIRAIKDSSGTIIGWCMFAGPWKNDCCTTPDSSSSSSSGGG